MTRRTHKHAFSMVELVIVIVIIGIIAAIAVPRISRGAKGASDSALRGDLAVLRNAIDLYAAEHAGNFPTVADFSDQLTTYSDSSGGTSDTMTGNYIYGPYLKAVPGLPIAGVGTAGGEVGDTGVAADDGDASGIGWLYTVGTGDIVANTGTAADDSGTAYSTY